MHLTSAVSSLVLAAIALPAMADNAIVQPVSSTLMQRIRGKIDSYDPLGRVLSVIVSGHKTVSVTLEPDLRVVNNEKVSLSAVKAGDFVGATVLKSGPGTLRAQEVHIFPEELRGSNEGWIASGNNSNRAMLNATVTSISASASNRGSIKLSYHGDALASDGSCVGRASTTPGSGCTGEAEIAVVPGIPIIAIEKSDESILVPGARVALSAVASGDGRLESSRLTVEKGTATSTR